MVKLLPTDRRTLLLLTTNYLTQPAPIKVQIRSTHPLIIRRISIPETNRPMLSGLSLINGLNRLCKTSASPYRSETNTPPLLKATFNAPVQRPQYERLTKPQPRRLHHTLLPRLRPQRINQIRPVPKRINLPISQTTREASPITQDSSAHSTLPAQYPSILRNLIASASTCRSFSCSGLTSGLTRSNTSG